MQIFACTYVLVFATLASVMTGYRAQLTGYFRYESRLTSPLLPMNQVLRPGLIVEDGHRIDLPDSRVYAVNTLSALPNGPGAQMFDINGFVDRSSELADPVGILIDYYFTCYGLMDFIRGREISRNASHSKARSLVCSIYQCSCSAPDLLNPEPWSIGRRDLFANMTSTIVVGGILRELAAPPLSIGLPVSIHIARPSGGQSREIQNASDVLADGTFDLSQSLKMVYGSGGGAYDMIYMHNDTALEEATIKDTGRCIAEDAYSWGFSSLLLLTFCSYTILFAVTLIALQTDVYWNSRHDRDHQSHSVYTDVLYLAEELKASFGSNVNDHLQSPKKFQKEVESCTQGLRLDVQGLPLSRMEAERERNRLPAPPRPTPSGRKLRKRPPREHDLNLSHDLCPSTAQDYQLLGIPTTPDPDRASSRLTPASSFTTTVPSSQRSTLAEPGSPTLATHSSAGASADEEQALIGDSTRGETQLSNDEIVFEAHDPRYA